MDYKDKIRKLLALAKSPEPEEAKFARLKDNLDKEAAKQEASDAGKK